MIKSKKQMYIVIGAFALVLTLFTTTYAFFNYTRTGSANIIKTGRIYFNSEQGTAINLTNLFPIDPEDTGIMNDATKVGTVTINVTGDTTYGDGIEYLVTAVNVQNSVGNKNVPISINVSVENNTGNDPATSLGTSDTDYFINRGPSAQTSIYKVLSTDAINEGDQLVVGYIKSGQDGVDGNIVIKAYIDKNKITISDTYPEGDITHTEGVEPNQTIVTDYSNGTTDEWVDEREVLTTTEWNSLQQNGVSFQVRVEANEGIWVSAPAITITYNLTGGTMNSTIKTIDGTASTYGELGVPTKANSLFEGWYTDETGGTKVEATTPFVYGTSPTLLYAHWEDLSLLPSTISSCSGCVYKYTTEDLYLYNSWEQTVLQEGDYDTDYKITVANSGKRYFLGLVLDEDGLIINGYACGLKEDNPNKGTPYCIEGGYIYGFDEGSNADVLHGIYGATDDYISNYGCTYDDKYAGDTYSGGESGIDCNSAISLQPSSSYNASCGGADSSVGKCVVNCNGYAYCR